MSSRLIETLSNVDVIYAEDTRRTSILLNSIGVTKPLRSYFVGNEEARSRELAQRLAGGDTVALVTDAGTPAVADPGLSAVNAARSVDAEIGVVPGPSAVTAALACSGFPGDRFVFEGFLPRKSRKSAVGALAREQRTIVVFTTPHRIAKDLADLGESLGLERAIFVGRELTKKFEELWWGTIEQAIETWTTRPARGEFTVVIAGFDASDRDDGPAAEEHARRLMSGGMSRSEAARETAGHFGVSRRDVYERLR